MGRSTLLVLIAAGIGLAFGDPTAAAADSAAPPVSTFVETVLRDGLGEIDLAKLAVARTTSPDVKRFAQRMIDDHTALDQELAELARARNLAVPDALDPGTHALHERLAALPVRQLDRAYMRAMLDGHQRTIAAFRAYAEGGADPEIRAWAEKTLPTIEDHAHDAKASARAIGIEVGAERHTY